ncbi:helix-turn-helix transcriptional regulator [Aliivibrio fischeri]|uniref:helix-turn-helix transcriptional regulator n=1 Tax=Aliivibrio fischeri TaxID=668 RepID=UPI0007C4E685|nr:helix-turn-helix domain-containing protein [Aliivibrio fischeri]
MLNKTLKIIRQYHQLDISSLAFKLNITRNELVSIEAGKSTITPKLLQQYSNLFEIPQASLLFFSESIANEGKIAKKFRMALAGKILNVADWVAEKNDKKIKA